MKAIFETANLRLTQPEEAVYLLSMNKKQNILDTDLIDQLLAACDFLETKTSGPGCLVTSSELARTYSAGLNLKELMKGADHPDVRRYLQHFMSFLARFVTLPMVTVAAINGHAYAGGLMFALAHDYRLMNRDFGNLCLSEIKFGIFLPPGMNAICQSRIPAPFYKYIALLGDPVPAKEGLRMRFIDELHPKEHLLPRALELAAKMAPSAEHRGALGKIKAEMNRDLVKTL